MHIWVTTPIFCINNPELIINFISQRQIFKMVRQAPKVPFDQLAEVHEISTRRLDGYCKKRPIFNNMSQRRKKAQFLADINGYEKYLHEAYLHIVGGCEAGQKQGSHSVLNFIKTSLKDHATANIDKKVNSTHVYECFKIKEDIPERNPYKKKCSSQKRFLQIVGAELQSTAMVLYLEQALIQAEILTKEDSIKSDDPLIKVSTKANDCLDDLRILYLS